MKKPGKDAFMLIAGAVGGAVVGKMAIRMIPIENGLIKSLIPIAAGLMLSGNKSAVIKGAGLGMAAAGGLTLVEALAPGMLGAPDFDETIFLGEAEEIGEYEELNAPADQSILSAPADQSILSAPEDMDEMNAAQTISASFEME